MLRQAYIRVLVEADDFREAEKLVDLWLSSAEDDERLINYEVEDAGWIAKSDDLPTPEDAGYCRIHTRGENDA